ncbi:class I SAM-dependent methyltransferase [Streptomyces sp. H10-C2]|uniref:class I SAM-dependent methyltransferase n=1 Tax=unclassified Streptomyces TaxID=2593676 RepID=UPI0024BBB16D|nr:MULTISPECIES: class I SAM-dependent methyltransferase [unclassified Streptomyces]MDJ0344325.1 class I SAM-dependent methyltransferase [Streptomyces sp. PH10-H1]MDJ0373694.1 class I SAM-dependent methyltransferase [Streptomyces sp. H10-C2]
MLNYDVEAERYDATRGGVPRAEAAARAVLRLVPDGARTLLDVGCGTGLVTERLVRPGLRVIGVDASAGMAATAVGRVGRAVVLGDSRQLPFASGSLDAVSAVWLLHLLPDAAEVVAECARVLRPGGVFITTVDKDAAHPADTDVDALLAPHVIPDAYDEAGAVVGWAAGHGLRPGAETSFTGHGQGRSPALTVEKVRAGYFASALEFSPRQAQGVIDGLSALPDQHTPRPDPVYRLLALGKDG